MSKLPKIENTKRKKGKLGFSSSMCAFGGYSIAGAPGVNHAYIYDTRTKDTKQIAKLSGDEYSSRFGHCVHMNAAGNVAIVSDPYRNEKAGAVYIYTRNKNDQWDLSWDIYPTNMPKLTFGWVVRLNEAGNIAMITAPGAVVDPVEGRQGIVYFCENDNGDWKEVSRIEGIESNAHFGFTAAMSEDGQTVLIGDYSKETENASLYFFEKRLEEWHLAFSSSCHQKPPIQMAVSLNRTGDVALVGCGFKNKVELYRKIDSKWDQVTERILGESNMKDHGFGQSVSLNAKGDIAAIGAYREDNETGAVYIYKIENDQLVFNERLATDIAQSRFGCSVSLSESGETVLVGCSGQDNGKGAIYAIYHALKKAK